MVTTAARPPGAVPPILYGTAWTEDATEELVVAALRAGFRGLDTANQRKHYDEAGVGRALARCLADGSVRRDDLFLQSKYTFRDGQDDRLPYDPSASIAEQVAQSFASSRAHLGVTWLDSLVLHGPSQREDLGAADHAAWRAMEGLVDTGAVGVLGISNVSANQLTELLAFARVAPTFVQNRCYAERGWDRMVREVCTHHGAVYPAFPLLTANRAVVADTRIADIAMRHRLTPAQIVLRFAQQRGMLPLTGTRNPLHMVHDLAISTVTLTADELHVIDGAGGSPSG